ncbi:hypothetical protein [Ammoniphilus resinae]|uniref:DUF2642 domain-containing protein n=1 Tax=Ammoniphilus resinae TaxID=861532 RepID=A0ABS4GS85_9BACL|nr:hypothetical protein [Ammoniphilus resinae]MBP1933136.1 hypothetical protein [Ammoniphilus resinae]
MLADVRKELKELMGHSVEVHTKQATKISGTLSWLSPDFSMAELTSKDGEIKTVTDVQIKSIRKIS